MYITDELLSLNQDHDMDGVDAHVVKQAVLQAIKNWSEI